MASNDWWSKKLGVEPARRESAPTTPAQREAWSPSPRPAYPKVEYDPGSDQLTTRAQSARQTESCPSCFSANYMAAPGTNLKRCYDCGHPLVQSGTGASIPSSPGAEVMPSRQAHIGNNFNPNVIVDRIN